MKDWRPAIDGVWNVFNANLQKAFKAVKAKPILTMRRRATRPIRRPSTETDLLRTEVCPVADHFSSVSCRWSWNWTQRSQREKRQYRRISETRHRLRMTENPEIPELDLVQFFDLEDVEELLSGDLVASHCFFRTAESLFLLKLQLCRLGKVDESGESRAMCLKQNGFYHQLKVLIKKDLTYLSRATVQMTAHWHNSIFSNVQANIADEHWVVFLLLVIA